MKIIDKHDGPPTTIDKLEQGDVCRDREGTLFLKTDERDGEHILAVSLIDGTIWRLFPNTEVTSVNAEVVIP